MPVDLQLKTYVDRVDARLNELLPSPDKHPVELFRAMRYACLSPGKRLRPALCLAGAEAAGGDTADALDPACAIEMVHSFSLIHDDLPALDDDDLRRGRPTCHKEFGEAVAILAGDALFAHAFQCLAKAEIDALLRLRCLEILSVAIGVDGVVAGETADILAEGRPIDADELEFIHTRKTGTLIAASCEMGAVAAGGDDEAAARLRRYGEAVGLAFQIADDVLNETGTPEQLGKSAGSDRERGKATYPALFGVEASRERALMLADHAVGHLDDLPGPVEFLRELATFAVERLR